MDRFRVSNVSIHFAPELLQEASDQAYAAQKAFFETQISSEEFISSLKKMSDIFKPLDAGERFVARVLGHEFMAQTIECTCGAYMDDGEDFAHHVRRVLREAEEELP